MSDQPDIEHLRDLQPPSDPKDAASKCPKCGGVGRGGCYSIVGGMRYHRSCSLCGEMWGWDVKDGEQQTNAATPTPLTDAAHGKAGLFPETDAVVNADFARTLEHTLTARDEEVKELKEKNELAALPPQQPDPVQ